ncbi:MAG: DNA polymerase III subunit alpha [Planctomycetales bacterium]|nr:DNA polymerase III subunit alpha [Planctomycetales bacterium]
MPDSGYVHLHVHSHYSLLDGACTVEGLIEAAAERGMRSLALTDHGALFGAVEFYGKARDRGVKPILGCEAYVAPRSRFEKTRSESQEIYWHLLLLARDLTGYKNLVKLASAAYREGFYYRPRVDKELLRKHGEGLIATSGCLQGEVNQHLLSGDLEGARASAREYREIFGPENFYLEIQDHGIDEQRKLNPLVRDLSKDLGLPLVATNDIHYLTREAARAHDALLCISTGKLLSDPERWRFPGPEFWFKGADDMRLLFPDAPDAVENTVAIAERCNVELPLGHRRYPVFRSESGVPNSQLLKDLCEEGLRRRYGDPPPAAATERLRYELSVIEKLGFVSYFLIVWDLIRFARDQGIPVGPGRGSAAGSLVAYTLAITDVDPIEYDLLFERFLNPGRNEPPDIDVDICQVGRPRVIEYVRKKYGDENVCQIITFGTLAARRAVRDVGRVMDIPLTEVDRLAKLIPQGPDMSIEKALRDEPELSDLYRTDPRVQELFDVSRQLEGLCRDASTHAAGVVISDRPLDEDVPLYVPAGEGGEVTTQYTMEALDKIGLLKMDLLGLKTLTVLDGAVRRARETRGVTVDLRKIPLDDAPVYALLTRADTKGIFQLESRGMRDLLQRLKPDRFADLIAVLALYRPGPLGSGMVDAYVRRKHGEEKVTYPHPSLEPILAETNGVMLYQEQVMRIANRLAGFSLSDADTLRKAMGKKKPEVMAKFKQQFLTGCGVQKIPRETAEKIWEQMEFFSGYGFNRSHSAAYALVSYQTGYMKVHYPAEFLAATLTSEADDTDKVVELTDDCRRMGIEVLPPDVNESESTFSVRDGRIRFGLAGVKGVGERAVESLIAARRACGGRFRTLLDITERVDLRLVTRGVLEALVRAGALDSLGARRSQLSAVLDAALEIGNTAATDRRRGQAGLFGAPASEGGGAPSLALPDVPEWPEAKRLADEKSLLGLYVSSHPLARHATMLERFATAATADLGDRRANEPVVLGGIVLGVRTTVTKAGAKPGSKMATFSLEDLRGVVKAVIFPNDYERSKQFLVEDRVVFVRGRVDHSREEPGLKVSEVIPIEKSREALCQKVVLRMPSAGLTDDLLRRLQELLRNHAGPVPVFLRVGHAGAAPQLVRAGHAFGVIPSEALDQDLTRILGDGHVEYYG